MEDSNKNNIQIKEKENTEQFRNPRENKVSDVDVLDVSDQRKIDMLGYAYEWAKNNNDSLMADAIHFQAVDHIRRHPKYNGTGYGREYIDNYYYENDNEFVLNECLDYQFESAGTFPILINLIDSFSNSGALDMLELGGININGMPIGEIIETAVKFGVPIADFLIDELQPWQTEIRGDDYVLSIKRYDESKVLYPTKTKVKFYFHKGESEPYHIEE